MIKTIGTHSGHFHCDEALAVFLLRKTAAFKDAQLVRTRDPKLLDKCDVVVDVGGVYDTEKLRYDHHQRGFFETFTPTHKTKLSSAGLVYKHYGAEVIAARIALPEIDPTVQTIYRKLYSDFIEALDGIDNGISQYPPELEPEYRDCTGLSARVGRLNPLWNETTESVDVDARFEQASQLAGDEFFKVLEVLHKAWLPARDIVLEGFARRHEVDQSGSIVLLTRSCPWKEHLFDIEAEQSKVGEVIYVLYEDESKNWRIQCMPRKPTGFDNRKSLPESWRGRRDAELSEISKIPGCIFVHASGFIGGNKTRDGALEMTKMALRIE
jgi:uncharacterized UPF0160 family protein